MKNIQKSIRMSQDIYEYIAAFDGKNFNDKFENCIKICMNQNRIIRRNKIKLDKEIYDLTNKIQLLLPQIRPAQRVILLKVLNVFRPM